MIELDGLAAWCPSGGNTLHLPCSAKTPPLPRVFCCFRGEDTVFALRFHCLHGEDTAFALSFRYLHGEDTAFALRRSGGAEEEVRGGEGGGGLGGAGVDGTLRSFFLNGLPSIVGATDRATAAAIGGDAAGWERAPAAERWLLGAFDPPDNAAGGCTARTALRSFVAFIRGITSTPVPFICAAATAAAAPLAAWADPNFRRMPCAAPPSPTTTTWPAAPARPGCAPRLRLPMLPRPPLFALCCGEPGLKCLVEMDARKQKSTAGSNRHASALRSKCGPPAHITTLITSCITRP